MSWIATAAIGSSLIGAYASNQAANKQANAANNAANLQYQMYQQNQQNLQPYMQGGASTMGTMQAGLAPGGQFNTNFTAQDYLNNQDPGYQFQLQQGQNALQNSQAAGSGALSGAAMKGLIGYNQDYASTGYQNAFNRWQSNQSNIYSRLMGLAGLGENAAAGAGNAATSFGQSIGNAGMAAGAAGAAGTVGTANALMGGINNGAGYYYMNQLMNQGGGGGSPSSVEGTPIGYSMDSLNYNGGQSLYGAYGK
jgi:hypothetical protein